MAASFWMHYKDRYGFEDAQNQFGSRQMIRTFSFGLCLASLPLALAACNKPASSAADYPASVDEAIAQISDGFSRLQSYTARIRGRVSRSPGQVVSTGTVDGRIEIQPGDPVARFRIEENANIRVEMPGLAKTVQQQQQTTIIGDGNFVYNIVGANRQRRAMKLPADKTGAGDVRQLLRSLQANQNVKLLPATEIEGIQAITLESTPRDPETRRVVGRSVFCFHPTHGVLLRREQFSPDGESAVLYEYYERRFNVPLDDSRFKFDPKGVKLIDQTGSPPTGPRKPPPQSQPAVGP
ncbi:MAG: outer membrane lipoprotein carrier protein LolA [Planctomycetota bacterium]|nr:MAG: outer membrane lipoprotein carrier protein LolA [Planctomycetota bacterium]